MIRTALKTIFAHKVRLLLTAMSVMIGVAFIAGTFIFTDTINQTFDNLFEDTYAGQDVIVQGEAEFDVGFGGPPPIDESVLDIVLAVDGVDAAEGGVTGFAVIYDNEGNAIVPQGPPTLGVSGQEDERLRGNVVIREGREPSGMTEVAIDAKTAGDNGLTVGQPVRIQTVDGVGEYELVGVIGFGEADNLAGATIAVWDTTTAQTLLGLEGVYNAITVVGEDGVSPDLLRNSITVALPEGVEAVTAADEAAAQSETLQEGLSFLNTALLVFAAVAVFVAAFIIQNTFRIIVRQRQRELALMRAVGATGGQVIWMVAIEALIVGVFASIVGILLGFVIAGLLTAGMSAIGFDLPSTTASLAPRTIIVGLIVGVGVTLAAAVLPAVRSGADSAGGGAPGRRRPAPHVGSQAHHLWVDPARLWDRVHRRRLVRRRHRPRSAQRVDCRRDRCPRCLPGGQHAEFAHRSVAGSLHRLAAAQDRQPDGNTCDRQRSS